MAFQISNACTNCGACLPKCPTGSISTTPLQYIIDADTCDNHAACVSVCPVNAITPAPSRIALLKADSNSKEPTKKPGTPTPVAKSKEPSGKQAAPASQEDSLVGSLEAIMKEYEVE